MINCVQTLTFWTSEYMTSFSNRSVLNMSNGGLWNPKLTQNKQDKSPGSKLCQLGVKWTRFQNLKEKRKWFFDHSTTLRVQVTTHWLHINATVDITKNITCVTPICICNFLYKLMAQWFTPLRRKEVMNLVMDLHRNHSKRLCRYKNKLLTLFKWVTVQIFLL